MNRHQRRREQAFVRYERRLLAQMARDEPLIDPDILAIIWEATVGPLPPLTAVPLSSRTHNARLADEHNPLGSAKGVNRNDTQMTPLRINHQVS